jgi:hypothetical protein
MSTQAITRGLAVHDGPMELSKEAFRRSRGPLVRMCLAGSIVVLIAASMVSTLALPNTASRLRPPVSALEHTIDSLTFIVELNQDQNTSTAPHRLAIKNVVPVDRERHWRESGDFTKDSLVRSRYRRDRQ